MFHLHSFHFFNIRYGKVKCISSWDYNRLNQREISIDGNHEMVRRPHKILLLEAGELLWAWSMDDPLTQIPRLSTFWPIAALHRCIITRVNNELACRPISMAQVPASKKVHLSFASCTRCDVRTRYGTRDRGGHSVSFFKGGWITLEKIHFDYVAIVCARGEGKSFFLGTCEWKSHRLIHSFPI